MVRNVRLSDAVRRADVAQMGGDCATGEALDPDGHHVRAHQVSVWVAKLPNSERKKHTNVIVDNLVSMNSRADGLNVHGAVDLASINDIAKQHYPLCFRDLHATLRDTHHLQHNARNTYTLFLKVSLILLNGRTYAARHQLSRR